MLSLFWLHLVYNGWLDSSQNRGSKCHRNNLSLIPLFYDHWAPFLTCFHAFLISNLFACISLLIPIFFFKIENLFYHLVLFFWWPHKWAACLSCDIVQAFQHDIPYTMKLLRQKTFTVFGTTMKVFHIKISLSYYIIVKWHYSNMDLSSHV